MLLPIETFLPVVSAKMPLILLLFFSMLCSCDGFMYFGGTLGRENELGERSAFDKPRMG